MAFYKVAYAADGPDGVLLEPRRYLPKGHGIWSPPAAPNGLHLKLEAVATDLMSPVQRAGREAEPRDPLASSERIQQQVSKCPSEAETGFLVPGAVGEA